VQRCSGLRPSCGHLGDLEEEIFHEEAGVDVGLEGALYVVDAGDGACGLVCGPACGGAFDSFAEIAVDDAFGVRASACEGDVTEEEEEEVESVADLFRLASGELFGELEEVEGVGLFEAEDTFDDGAALVEGAVGDQGEGAGDGAFGEVCGELGELGFDGVLEEDGLEVCGGEGSEAQELAAAADGAEEASRLVGEEDEEGVSGGLLQGFEEGVGAFDGDGVDVVDEDDAPDLLAVGGEGEEVGVLVGFDAAAVAALAAGGEGVGALAEEAALAAEGLGHPQGDLALASAGPAGEEPRVVEALAAEGLRDAGAGARVAIDIVEGVGGGGHQGLRERGWAGP
jgi:hypothetical protein